MTKKITINFIFLPFSVVALKYKTNKKRFKIEKKKKMFSEQGLTKKVVFSSFFVSIFFLPFQKKFGNETDLQINNFWGREVA